MIGRLFPGNLGNAPVLTRLGLGMTSRKVPCLLPPVVPFLSETVIVIPALDESASIGPTIRRWRELGAGRVRVVDNGSTDDTAAQAASCGAEVLREGLRGYGAAAWRGLENWPGDFRWVIFSSADGSDRMTPAEARLWQAAVDDGADLVIGDRTATADSRRHLRPMQRLGNCVTSFALTVGWGRRFHDMGSLRLVGRRSLAAMRLTDRGFGWNVEMQVRAMELGCAIVELPVGYHPRSAGKSKISGNLVGTLRAGKGILSMLARMLWWRLNATRRIRDDAAMKAGAGWASEAE